MLGLDWGCGREKHRVSGGRWSPGSKWIRSCLEKWAFTLRVSYLLINPHSDSFYYQFQNYESEFAQLFWLIRASLLCLVFVIAFYIRNNLIGQTFGIPSFGTGEQDSCDLCSFHCISCQLKITTECQPKFVNVVAKWKEKRQPGLFSFQFVTTTNSADIWCLVSWFLVDG